MNTRIVIVDNHPTFRHDLALYLTLLDGRYKVVGEAGTAEDGLARITALAPDIVLTDIDLPDRHGLPIIRRICQSWPGITIIVISNNPALDYRGAALEAGAFAYVDKLELIKELPDALAGAARRVGAPASREPTISRSASSN